MNYEEASHLSVLLFCEFFYFECFRIDTHEIFAEPVDPNEVCDAISDDLRVLVPIPLMFIYLFRLVAKG